MRQNPVGEPAAIAAWNLDMLAEAEVSAPFDEVWGEIIDDLQQTEAPRPAGEIPDFHLERVECFWRDAPLAPVIRDAEPKELALFRACHRAFRLVDLQPELLGQEPAH